MSAKKKESDGALVVPEQDKETREQILRDAPKGTTATGAAYADEFGEVERVEGEDRGSKTPIDQGDSIVADYSGQEVQPAVGLQAEPALFTSNGSLNPGFVASPGGPVPVSAVAGDLESANARLDQHHKAVEESYAKRRGQYEALTQAQIDSMSGAELRAVGVDRGYSLGDGSGTRTARRRFAKEQEKDEALKKGEGEGSSDAGSTGSSTD